MVSGAEGVEALWPSVERLKLSRVREAVIQTSVKPSRQPIASVVVVQMFSDALNVQRCNPDDEKSDIKFIDEIMFKL